MFIQDTAVAIAVTVSATTVVEVDGTIVITTHLETSESSDWWVKLAEDRHKKGHRSES